MRLAGLRWSLFWAVAILLAGVVAGCDNPFDPLSKTDKIEGLTYFDFAASQEHWDSDPEWDGIQITMTYYNEFGDQLSFHDKPHKIEVEIWSQRENDADPPVIVRDKLLATKTVEFSNSDDLIRIPIESYFSALPPPETTTTETTTTESVRGRSRATGYTEPVTGYLLLRVFPPQGYPQSELVFLQSAVELYTPEDAPLTLE